MEIITFESRDEYMTFLFERIEKLIIIINEHCRGLKRRENYEIKSYINMLNKYQKDIEKMNPLVKFGVWKFDEVY